MTKEKSKRKYSVQLSFVSIFVLFIALAIYLLNTYPTISSRDIVFSSKRETMLSQASVMSSSLSGLEKLSSDGVEQVIENIKHRQSNIIIGCNIVKSELTSAADAPLEYLRLFRPLYQYADYFTVNIADNTSTDCYVPFDKEEINAILTPLFEFRRGQNQYRPILLKISPDLSDEQIDVMTDIMLETPLDGIVACGGTIGRHGLENSTSAIHAIGRTEGALCGKPLQDRALQVIKRIYERSKGTYPIIGCGGITSPDDAKAMLDAGATLVQICSEFIYGGGDSLRNMQLGLNERIRKAELNSATTTESNTPTL